MNRRLALNPHRPWLFLALILVVAGFLRFYRIDAQSLWNDEGNSARLAERSIHLILEGARGDIHPPGYYLALHYWRALLGQSEAALRGLSALSSVALALFTFQVSRRLFDDDVTGLVAAALVAINPFEVYYAQEARMYAMLSLWAMASTWALLAWWQTRDQQRRGARWPWLAYVLTATAGLYTHYAFPFVMLAQSLSVGIWLWITRRREGTPRHLLSWILAQVAVVMLYLPWLSTAWHQVTSWSPPREAYRLPTALADTWRLLNFGQTIPTRVVTGGLIAAGAFALSSLLPLAEETNKRRAERLSYPLRWGLLALLILVPLGLIFGLGLYRAAYRKFLLVAAAPLSTLTATGIITGWHLGRRSSMSGKRAHAIGVQALTLFLLTLFLYDTGRSLNNLYFDEAYARDDYRAIARYIENNARAGDAVILNAPNQWEVFTYYHPDDAHVFPLARQRPLDVTANEAELEHIVADHQRLFAIFWGDVESDPERFIESWLETHTYKAHETWYGDVRLAIYAVPAEVADAPKVSLDARFAPGGPATPPARPAIILEGYTLLNQTPAAGDILQLALFWHAEERIPDRYKVFVHLYDEAGEVAAQTDSEPGATLRPTDTWMPGERVVDRYGVLIPAELPLGAYALTVGLYDLTDPTDRLHVFRDGVSAGDHLGLTQVIVTSDADSSPQD
jgi:4-amino-4-deoxy-L-arabinose transferase-like glycosyltransferase